MGISEFIDGNVHIASERALQSLMIRRADIDRVKAHQFHAAVAGPYRPEHGLKGPDIVTGLFWRPATDRDRLTGLGFLYLKLTSCQVLKRFPSDLSLLGSGRPE
jgi:hypothetical protein